MSFSGFDQHSDLEAERRKFLEGGLRAVRDEKLATYVWGEDSYDGLGDALQEGGDELNDETFGGPGAVGKDMSSISRPHTRYSRSRVGKDFDFSSSTLPLDLRPPAAELASIAPPTRFKDTDSKALQPTPPGMMFTGSSTLVLLSLLISSPSKFTRVDMG